MVYDVIRLPPPIRNALYRHRTTSYTIVHLPPIIHPTPNHLQQHQRTNQKPPPPPTTHLLSPLALPRRFRQLPTGPLRPPRRTRAEGGRWTRALPLHVPPSAPRPDLLRGRGSGRCGGRMRRGRHRRVLSGRGTEEVVPPEDVRVLPRPGGAR